MSFANMETGVATGRPVELFEISFTGNFWYFTSADTNIVFENRTYVSRPITRTDLTPSADVNQNKLTVTFPADVAFGEIFRVQPPSEVVLLRMLVKNFITNDYIVAWQGRIIAMDWKFPYVEVTSESVFSALQRPGLRRRYSTTCPYALYGSQCGVSRVDFREITPCLNVSGLTIVGQSSIGKADNYYAGGYATWENLKTGNVEKRMIRSSVGSTGALTLSSFPIGLAGGRSLQLFPGCDHRITTCRDKFDNVVNCGATPFIPQLNPFAGSTLY